MVDALRRIQAGDDDRSEALRALGGLLIGIGALVLLYRKTSLGDAWGDFPVFVGFALPAILLYGGGLQAAREAAAPRAWHAVWIVFGILFLYASLLQFLELVDGDTGASLNVAWTLAVVAVASVAAAVLAGVRFGWLLGGIAASISWLAVWDEILADGIGNDAGTFRLICMLAAAVMVVGAVLAGRRSATDRSGATELITAAGLVFILGAGLVSLAGGAAAGIAGALSPVDTPTSADSPEASLFWDLVLLVGSLALIGVGTLVGSRGPAYVGVVGTGLFVTIVGLDLDDDSPAGAILGWPLILLLAGAAVIAASVYIQRNRPSA